MPGKAAKVVLTERRQEILQRWVRSRSCSRGLARRAEIILLAFDRLQNGPIAEQLGCDFCKEDNCIQCGENAETSVPGVYAAGNCSKGIQLVVSAVAPGMEAAFAINDALLDADAKSGALRKAGS